MTGRHQYLPVCKMRYDQEVFDALKYRIEVAEDGTRWYYNAAEQLHRTDGPAVEYSNGDKEWWQNDQLHRTDGPAIVHTNGAKFWHQNGSRHRIDGPAVEYTDGSKYWCQNGQRHRIDGPAVECANGYKEWWQAGELQRVEVSLKVDFNAQEPAETEFNQRVKLL